MTEPTAFEDITEAVNAFYEATKRVANFEAYAQRKVDADPNLSMNKFLARDRGNNRSYWERQRGKATFGLRKMKAIATDFWDGTWDDKQEALAETAKKEGELEDQVRAAKDNDVDDPELQARLAAVAALGARQRRSFMNAMYGRLQFESFVNKNYTAAARARREGSVVLLYIAMPIIDAVVFVRNLRDDPDKIKAMLIQRIAGPARYTLASIFARIVELVASHSPYEQIDAATLANVTEPAREVLSQAVADTTKWLGESEYMGSDDKLFEQLLEVIDAARAKETVGVQDAYLNLPTPDRRTRPTVYKYADETLSLLRRKPDDYEKEEKQLWVDAENAAQSVIDEYNPDALSKAIGLIDSLKEAVYSFHKYTLDDFDSSSPARLALAERALNEHMVAGGAQIEQQVWLPLSDEQNAQRERELDFYWQAPMALQNALRAARTGGRGEMRAAVAALVLVFQERGYDDNAPMPLINTLLLERREAQRNSSNTFEKLLRDDMNTMLDFTWKVLERKRRRMEDYADMNVRRMIRMTQPTAYRVTPVDLPSDVAEPVDDDDDDMDTTAD